MKKVTLEIDGKEVTVDEGTNLLEAAKITGADIPTLCYHEDLKPRGTCRLCMVEVTKKGWPKLVASCCYPAEDGITVKTNTPEIEKIRKTIVELMMPLTDTGPLDALASKYGLKDSRFKAERLECLLCGLCVRYCADIKGDNGVYFKGRGINREIALLPGQTAKCVVCKECWELCPGRWIVTESGVVED